MKPGMEVPMRLLSVLWKAGKYQVVVYSLFIVFPGLFAVASVHLLREVVDLAIDLIESERAIQPVVGMLALYLLVDLIKGEIDDFTEEMDGRHRE